MKKLLIAAAAATSLVALNTAAIAGGNDCCDVSKYRGAVNLGAIEQGAGINAAIINQVAANNGEIKFDDEEIFQEELEDMNDFSSSVSLIVGRDISAVSAGDDIEDEFVAAGDDIQNNKDVTAE
jgi:hypothetical protein